MNSRKNNSPPRCRLVDTIGMAAEFAAVTKRCGVWNIAVGRVTRPRVTAIRPKCRVLPGGASAPPQTETQPYRWARIIARIRRDGGKSAFNVIIIFLMTD